MINPRIANSLLLLSAGFTLGAVWFMREAEGYVSKHFGIEDTMAYDHFNQIGSGLFCLAVAFWGVSLAAKFRLVPEQRNRVQWFAALLPLMGVLLFVGAIFFFPVRYV